jgi:restriction endonuclease Mrr
MSQKKRFEISNPLEFEHFLHVGLENLRDASMLAQTQQAAFAEVAARRHRKLPTVPQDLVAARKKKIKMETEAKLAQPLNKHERDIYDDLLLTIESGDSERLEEVLASSDFDINRFS